MPYLNEILLVLSVLLMLAGLIGCFSPGLPGPIFSYLAVILLHLSDYGMFSSSFLIQFALLTLIVTALDYFLPIWGTKKFGGTKRGVWGAGIGLFLGILFFPPFGIIVGPFIGALVGELTGGKEFIAAIKSSFGSLLGFLAGTVLKLVITGLMLFYFIKELVERM
jgi:uncharacterized protein YqgC (DUF456 family)